jgi:hypothetical protein
MKILESKEFWAHDARLSNDRREITYAMGLMKLAIDSMKKDDHFNRYVGRAIGILDDPFNPIEYQFPQGYLFLASFSEKPNLLSQWRAYAPTNGYCLGFDSEALKKSVQDSGFSFGKIEYDLSKAVKAFQNQIKSYVAECVLLVGADESIEDCVERILFKIPQFAAIAKHESFSEEREWRAYSFQEDSNGVGFYAGNDSIRPFKRISLGSETGTIASLREVIIGPSEDHHLLRQWTIDYLRSLGYRNFRPDEPNAIRITVSGSPYRSRQK